MRWRAARRRPSRCGTISGCPAPARAARLLHGRLRRARRRRAHRRARGRGDLPRRRGHAGARRALGPLRRARRPGVAGGLPGRARRAPRRPGPRRPAAAPARRGRRAGAGRALARAGRARPERAAARRPRRPPPLDPARRRAPGRVAAMAEQGPLSGPELWRRSARRSVTALMLANGVAAVIVFVYGSWIVPVPHVPHTARVTLINLGVFLVCIP